MKTLRKTKATAQTRKCVLPRTQKFFAGRRVKQEAADTKKARGFLETSLSPTTNSGSRRHETTETTLDNATAGVLGR